jgi:hypothetical protein
MTARATGRRNRDYGVHDIRLCEIQRLSAIQTTTDPSDAV